MSDAMKRLDEIQARLRASSGGRWELSSSGTGVTSPRLPDDWLIACQLRRGDADLIAHAPADLALLVRLVRSVAEGECCGATTGQACILEPMYVWCWPCRIRRELSGVAR